MTPTPRLALTTIVATLAYLGLAILGWGGSALSSHPAAAQKKRCCTRISAERTKAYCSRTSRLIPGLLLSEELSKVVGEIRRLVASTEGPELALCLANLYVRS